jgi:uncharacterized protein YkwD
MHAPVVLPMNERQPFSAPVDRAPARPATRARRAALRAILAAAAALPAILTGGAPAEAAGCAGANVGPGLQDVGRADEAVLCLVDDQRRHAGLAPLRPDAALGAAATRHSRDMVARDYFGHYDPSGSGPVARARSAGFCRRACRISEDLAWGMSVLATPAAMVRDWMHSAEHRAIILDPRQRLTGIGVVYGAPGQRGQAATLTEDFAW